MRRNLLWGAAFGGALFLIFLGVRLDELTQTMMNAIMVCLACMGVG